MNDPELTALLSGLDPQLLGTSIRSHRLAAGRGQSEVAEAAGVSISYISRIEGGRRRCHLALLKQIAAFLEADIGAILGMSTPAPASDALPPEVEFAMVALEMGDAATALSQLDDVTPDLALSSPEVGVRVSLVRARALEALGRLTDAVEVLEGLERASVSTPLRIEAAIVQSRCYRESGELTRAIRVGEAALELLTARGLSGGDEAIQLSLGVAAAYFEQGDRDYALRLCHRALTEAEGLGSPRARAAAYWNCSIMELERGQTGDAVGMARRALALLSEGQDERNVARLRTELASMELRMDPPNLVDAAELLELSRDQLRTSSAGQVDIWRNHLAIARLALLSGEPERALTESLEVPRALGGSVPHLEADAYATAGQAAISVGRTDEARRHFLDAVRTLSVVGDDRSVGQLWM
ncbi:MAG: helix-turn-helix protein, partial [Nocardioidaceae bacterium]|nr:helix-turn-helix protein [Nocardioidaceae bacterium]